jgi:hypothetical protein
MGIWRAQVSFPDGTVRHTKYSTVVNAIDGNHLFKSPHSMSNGQPEACFPEGKVSAAEQLVLLRIALDRDNVAWSALYCPNRRTILGPLSPNSMGGGSDKFMLMQDRSAIFHLVSSFDIYAGDAMDAFGRGDAVTAMCGTEVLGEANTIDSDLYAAWNDSKVCRRCLLHDSVMLPAA